MKNEITKGQATMEIVQGLVRGYEAAKNSGEAVYVLVSKEYHAAFGRLVRLALSSELLYADEFVVDSFDPELCYGDVWPIIPALFEAAERAVDEIF